MKKTIVFIAFLLASHFALPQPVYSQSRLLDSVARAAANYLDGVYGHEAFRYFPEDLNCSFQVVDVGTRQPIKDEVQNGTIYYCHPRGDDMRGIYLLLDNGYCKLLKIENTLQVERVRLFMIRHNYTQEQMNRCFDYITTIYIMESCIWNYPECMNTEDYIEYMKEFEMSSAGNNQSQHDLYLRRAGAAQAQNRGQRHRDLHLQPPGMAEYAGGRKRV